MNSAKGTFQSKPESLAKEAHNAVQIKELSLSFSLQRSNKPLRVLDAINLDIRTSEFISIIGPSGCGKTTLLLCLAGLIRQTSGMLTLAGLQADVVRAQHKIGCVFQKPAFFEWKTVLENICLPAVIRGLDKPSSRAVKLLSRVGLAGYENAHPHELSGGMLARAALARALVHEPDFLFFDEAFNHLDEGLRQKLNELIESMWLERRSTIVAITHSISEAVLLSDQVVLMSRKPSSILKTWKIDLPRPRTANLMCSPNFLAISEEIRHFLVNQQSENEI